MTSAVLSRAADGRQHETTTPPTAMTAPTPTVSRADAMARAREERLRRERRRSITTDLVGGCIMIVSCIAPAVLATAHLQPF